MLSVRALSGRLLGVLGPSGAGKTTLLLALSGLTPHHPHKQLVGVQSGNVPEPSRVAHLSQSESFFGMLTVRETLALAAALQPEASGTSGNERVDNLLQTLGLTAVANTRVGDATHRGISGGEKRRLAVGCELLGDPALLIADEPTTGLDSHQAERVVRLVRHTAASLNIPAVATLHQPRSSIWSRLDDVLVLAPRGRVIYHGPRSEAMSYFARLGYPCPRHTNPAEHIIDLVSTDFDSVAAAAADGERIERLAEAWARHHARRPAAQPLAASTARTPARRARRRSPLARLGLLVRRSWRQNARDAWLNGVRFVVCSGLALVFGEIFGRLGAPTAASVSERVALLCQWRSHPHSSLYCHGPSRKSSARTQLVSPDHTPAPTPTVAPPLWAIILFATLCLLCSAVALLLLCCCYSAVALLLLCCCSAAAPLLLRCCSAAAPLLLRCCSAAAPLLLRCCSAATLLVLTSVMVCVHALAQRTRRSTWQ